MAGRCDGGAGWNAGAAGRAIAGGGAGRAIAGGAGGRAIGGGAAGRAIAGGGAALAAGAAPPGPLRSWADNPVFVAIKEAPIRHAARQTPRRSMIAAPASAHCPEISTCKSPNRSHVAASGGAILRRRGRRTCRSSGVAGRRDQAQPGLAVTRSHASRFRRSAPAPNRPGRW